MRVVLEAESGLKRRTQSLAPRATISERRCHGTGRLRRPGRSLHLPPSFLAARPLSGLSRRRSGQHPRDVRERPTRRRAVAAGRRPPASRTDAFLGQNRLSKPLTRCSVRPVLCEVPASAHTWWRGKPYSTSRMWPWCGPTTFHCHKFRSFPISSRRMGVNECACAALKSAITVARDAAGRGEYAERLMQLYVLNCFGPGSLDHTARSQTHTCFGLPTRKKKTGRMNS